MASSSNNQILLKELIKQEFDDNQEYNDINSFFEFFASSQKMKEYELSDEEIISGIKGAGLDGGCDSVYIFLNNMLMNEEIVSSLAPIKDATITLKIIQAKNTTSFKEDVIMKWKTVSDNLLKFENDIPQFSDRYNNDILSVFQLFKELLIKLVRSKYKTIIKFSYISLASELHPNVESQAEELKEIIKKLFPTPNTSVQVEFIGADKLMAMVAESPQQDFLIPLVENPISTGHQKDYITLVKLSEYFNFITDENRILKNNIFEANVRDYQGSNSVNTGISESLNNGTGENFWWLNNGVTMLASNAHQPTGKEIVVTAPEIVNGLQTSNEIYNYFITNIDKLETETRSVLVRIIVPDDDSSRDRIILATNSQTSIPKSSLRVTDPIHWQIEMYLKNKGLFYDRRKNYYKNQGKKSHEIISVSFLAQCLITLLLQQPDQARRRPSTLLTNDDTYSKLYEVNQDLKLYQNCAIIGKRIDKAVKSITDLEPSQKSDILFYVLYSVVAKKLNTSVITSKLLTEFEVDRITEADISFAIEITKKCYRTLGGNGSVAKGTDLIVLIQKHLFTETNNN